MNFLAKPISRICTYWKGRKKEGHVGRKCGISKGPEMENLGVWVEKSKQNYWMEHQGTKEIFTPLSPPPTIFPPASPFFGAQLPLQLSHLLLLPFPHSCLQGALRQNGRIYEQ